MTSAEACRRLKNRAASASAKPIAASPSAGRAGAISCKASSASPPLSAESNARASGSRCTGRSIAGPASASISAMTRRRRAIPSALPLCDIRSASYVRYMFLFWTERRRESRTRTAGWYLGYRDTTQLPAVLSDKGLRQIPPSPCFKIARLGRSERREQAAVGFQVDERRPVEAIKASDQERRPPALDQGGQRRPDRVRPNRRAEGKRAAGLTVVGRTLTHEVPARFMQPIEDLDPLERLDPVQRRDPGLGDLDAADRPVNAPLPRTIETRSPWRTDDSDEGEAGVERLGRLDRDLVSPDFAQPHHDPARWFASSSLVPARLRFDRLAALEARQKLVMRHRLREPITGPDSARQIPTTSSPYHQQFPCFLSSVCLCPGHSGNGQDRLNALPIVYPERAHVKSTDSQNGRKHQTGRRTARSPRRRSQRHVFGHSAERREELCLAISPCRQAAQVDYRAGRNGAWRGA